MHIHRTNTSLFVTVLSACLGLLIVGVPTQAEAKSAKEACSKKATPEIKALLDEHSFIRPLAEFIANVSKIISLRKYDHPEQARKLTSTSNSYFSIGSGRERNQPTEVLYQNTKALVENNQVLIVTRLPRAGLADLLAKQPASSEQSQQD